MKGPACQAGLSGNKDNQRGTQIVQFPRATAQEIESLPPSVLQAMRFANKLQGELAQSRARKLTEAALQHLVATGDRAAWLKYREWREVAEAEVAK